jgi:hypothetical protein
MAAGLDDRDLPESADAIKAVIRGASSAAPMAEHAAAAAEQNSTTCSCARVNN